MFDIVQGLNLTFLKIILDTARVASFITGGFMHILINIIIQRLKLITIFQSNS